MSTVEAVEKKYENQLRMVLSRLLNNKEHEDLAMLWFCKREKVSSDEEKLVEDRYEREGMDWRQEKRQSSVAKSHERLTSLSKDPQLRQVTAELCQWLWYQSLPPRACHLYPKELKVACRPAQKRQVTELADIINEYF